ncbi:MAG TPA: DNA-processing protein DprA [Candidatus Kapabacteria bacterium]|nr:DNA-processing protein DprA [Candidatus Kapabacteria bacterium]
MLSIQEILAITYLPGITSNAARALAESGAAFDDLVRFPAADLARLGLRRAAGEAITSPDPYLNRALEQMECARALGARILHFWADGFPAMLREIYAPPIVLHVWGDLECCVERAIAVVGTRTASMYGHLAAERYAARFAAAGVTVVSGLARGIDSYAHNAVLKAGGRTLAVVASGLDQIQPAHAASLARRIAERGAVVSEYPFGVKALRPYFPQRNRIISGLAAATVVVESDERGGGMITAGFALDQNREVFAVPGPVLAEKSRGTNLLIRTDRARLTQSPDDVLDALGFHIAPETVVSPEAGRSGLTAFELQLYDLLGPEPLHVEMLCERSGMAPGDVLVNLLSLEFKGLVRQLAGKLFLRV